MAKKKKDASRLPAMQPYRGAQRLGLRSGTLDPVKAGLSGEAPPPHLR